MVKYLSQDGKDATFDFLVQLYVDDEKTPIEDPMQEWKETLARKKVYQEIVKARRSNINHRLEEPQAYNSVLDDPQ